jgi:hypothetical protein
MYKQLSLFPELTTRVVSNLDDEAVEYANSIPIPAEVCNIDAFKRDMQDSYKAGASKILGDIIDLLKKYTDLHES